MGIRLSKARQITMVGGVTLLALLLLLTRPQETPQVRVLPASPVVTQPVERMDVFPREDVSGHLQPARRAWLRFEVNGVVAGRQVEPGQSVVKGQPLLMLESQDYQDALILAQSNLQQAQQDLLRDQTLLKLAESIRALQEDEVHRLGRLGERSMASKTLVGNADVVLDQRRAEEVRLRSSVATGPQKIAARQAALDRARRDLDRTTLVAPFSGSVNQIKLDVGDFAGRNETALELIDGRLDFYTQVRGMVARSLTLGQSVTVELGKEALQATVVALQPAPDPETFTHALRLRMPDSEKRVGAAAIAQLPLVALKQVLVVPDTALLLDEGQAYLFKVREDRLQRMVVEPGMRVGSHQVISAGIEVGDSVVVRDVAALSDGQAVIVTVSPPSTEVSRLNSP